VPDKSIPVFGRNCPRHDTRGKARTVHERGVIRFVCLFMLPKDTKERGKKYDLQHATSTPGQRS
jgi:hypothetical protein